LFVGPHLRLNPMSPPASAEATWVSDFFFLLRACRRAFFSVSESNLSCDPASPEATSGRFLGRVLIDPGFSPPVSTENVGVVCCYFFSVVPWRESIFCDAFWLFLNLLSFPSPLGRPKTPPVIFSLCMEGFLFQPWSGCRCFCVLFIVFGLSFWLEDVEVRSPPGFCTSPPTFGRLVGLGLAPPCFSCVPPPPLFFADYETLWIVRLLPSGGLESLLATRSQPWSCSSSSNLARSFSVLFPRLPFLPGFLPVRADLAGTFRPRGPFLTGTVPLRFLPTLFVLTR